MNKNDMIDLLNHLITTGRFWHLEYAKQNVLGDEFQKIKKERDKFDNDLLKKGVDIINNIEPEGNIDKIILFMDNYKIVFSKEEYSSHQLEQILDSVKKSKNVYVHTSIKKLYIEKDYIVGYEVTYDSAYKDMFEKH